ASELSHLRDGDAVRHFSPLLRALPPPLRLSDRIVGSAEGDARHRVAVAATILFVAAMLQITWWPQTHYFAPGAALFALLYAVGVERMIDRGYGAFAYACVAVSFAIAIVGYAAAFLPQSRAKGPRMAVTEALDARPGGQLVIADATCFDVVFNSAEIDAAKIVWAHAADGGVEPLL